MLAICSKQPGLDSLVEERFGRAEYYVIFDEEKKMPRSIENKAKFEAAGAGGSAVRLLSENGVDVVLAPELGPKAMDAIKAFDMTVYRYTEQKTVRETIEDYRADKLSKIDTSTTASKHGMHKA
jgi:predicted Fe-Mo cluster-binding NifX family protein